MLTLFKPVHFKNHAVILMILILFSCPGVSGRERKSSDSSNKSRSRQTEARKTQSSQSSAKSARSSARSKSSSRSSKRTSARRASPRPDRTQKARAPSRTSAPRAAASRAPSATSRAKAASRPGTSSRTSIRTRPRRSTLRQSSRSGYRTKISTRLGSVKVRRQSSGRNTESTLQPPNFRHQSSFPSENSAQRNSPRTSSTNSPIFFHDRAGKRTRIYTPGKETTSIGGVNSNRPDRSKSSIFSNLSDRKVSVIGTSENPKADRRPSITNSRKRVVITPDGITEYRGDKIIRQETSPSNTRIVPPSSDTSKSLTERIKQQRKASREKVIKSPARSAIGIKPSTEPAESQSFQSPLPASAEPVNLSPRIGRTINNSREAARVRTIEKIQIKRDRIFSNSSDSIIKPAMTLDQLRTEQAPASQISPFETTAEIADGVTITGDNNIFINGDMNVTKSYPYIKHPSHTIYHHWPGYHRPVSWHNFCGDYFGISTTFSSFGISFGSYYRRYHPHGKIVYYRCGPDYYGVSYIYPGYHRKYIFVSYGGYWPRHYRYKRYYWYGCHPHRWYGRCRRTAVVEKNYYTYNYYGTNTSAVPQQSYSYSSSGDIIPDYDYFAKIRQRNQQQNQAETQAQDTALTESDIYFEKGVQAFSSKRYSDAVLNFRQAVILSPDDIVLPFAYSQALFATGKYAHSAMVLKNAVRKMEKQQQSVFFPRGLYEKDEILVDQIAALGRTTETEPFNSDFNLLLGYQLLGLGKTHEAKVAFSIAAKSNANKDIVEMLTDILYDMEKDNENLN